MQINIQPQLDFTEVKIEGAKDVEMKVLLGSEEGSDNIIMRYFRVHPGGHTPLHRHNYEHLIKIEKGQGVIIDENGNEHKVETDYNVYIAPNELHQFKSTSQDFFEFICIIPNKQDCKL